MNDIGRTDVRPVIGKNISCVAARQLGTKRAFKIILESVYDCLF